MEMRRNVVTTKLTLLAYHFFDRLPVTEGLELSQTFETFLPNVSHQSLTNKWLQVHTREFKAPEGAISGKEKTHQCGILFFANCNPVTKTHILQSAWTGPFSVSFHGITPALRAACGPQRLLNLS